MGCRHHLLLEVVATKSRLPHSEPTKLVLNRPTRPGQTGRKRGLQSSAAEALVRMWIDDAIEVLSRMRISCELDFVAARPLVHELAVLHTHAGPTEVGKQLNITGQAVREQSAAALVRLTLALKPYREAQVQARDIVRGALRE